jgi:basic membrane protein A
LSRNTWIWIGVAALAVVVIGIVIASSGGDDETTTTTVAAGETTTTAAETTTTAGETTTTAEGETTTTTEGGETTTTAAPAETMRIAVVAPSASNDLAFTQSIVDAVTVIEGERDVEVAITDGTFVVEDAAAAIRDYASQGYDLVIAHGSQYGGSLSEIAQDFPETAFAWGTAADTFGAPNVFAYEAASDEGGYVMGKMAAALTTSNTIGVVGPVEVGDAKLFVDGFKNGAEADDSGATVNVNYTGDFSNVQLASEAASAHIAAGADVLSGTAQMVVGAISVADDAGVPWFGTQANQSSLAPDIVVASQVYKWEVVLRDILAQMDSGTLGGTTYVINFENGGLVLEYNDAYPLPDEVKALADQVIADIISGAIAPTG